jgi:putative transposase
MGVNFEGKREVLGLWTAEREGAKLLNEIRSRGAEDILTASVDGLSGFPEAAPAAFPETRVQKRIARMVRNSVKFVSYKDLKAACADLKAIRRARRPGGRPWNNSAKIGGPNIR